VSLPLGRLAVPQLTTQRRLGAGPVLRKGSAASYHALAFTEGEPHLVRDDFGVSDGGAEAAPPGGGQPLLCLVHLTDLQLADIQSPTRFEFLNRRYADPRYAAIIPVQRAQEALAVHAVEATVRTVNSLSGPATGLAPQLAVTTGDAIDNAQWNELLNFLSLLDGGRVTPDSGGPRYEGVQALDWPDDFFWKPDGDGPAGPDVYQREFGFPRHPGLLARALAEFEACGLDMPWLTCYGNHEALNQGVGVVTAAAAAAMTGASKPVALPSDFSHDRAEELFTHRPETFLAGRSRAVTADPARRHITRREFVEAHFRPGARPGGHGFGTQNLLDGTAYYVHDTPAARLIALDTNCLAGGSAGCLDRQQARWLESRLAEAHASYTGPDGSEVRTGHEDRLVILFSHHGIDTLTNTAHLGPDGEPLLGSAEVLALVHRFGNVVLWLNGHTHVNAIRPRHHPGCPGRGFWEVTTCSIADWPCQTRLVEIADHGGYLAIVCTMADHDTPPVAPSLATIGELASLHRELSANAPFTGHGSHLAGKPADRNVELRIRPPFPPARRASG
jgi:metallophosphoesterase (TIGR03767 family)